MDIVTLRQHTAHLSEVWEYYIDHDSLPANRQWGRWLEWNPPERIEEAIKSLAKRLQKPQPMEGGVEGLHRYVTAALMGIRKKAGESLQTKMHDVIQRAWEPSTLDAVQPEPVTVARPAPTKSDWDRAREEAEEYQRQRRSLEDSHD